MLTVHDLSFLRVPECFTGALRRYLERVGEASYIDLTRRTDPARIERVWDNLRAVVETYGRPWILQLWTKDAAATLARGRRQLERLLAQVKELEKEISRLKDRMASQATGDILSDVGEVKGVKVLAVRMDGTDVEGLRAMADRLRQKLGTSAVLLASVSEGKVTLLCALTKDIAGKRLHAGELVKAVAKVVGGGGGGRPDMAQAGGRDTSKVDEAIELFYGLVREKLASS